MIFFLMISYSFLFTSLPVQQLNRVMETVTNRKRGNSDYDSGLATFEG